MAEAYDVAVLSNVLEHALDPAVMLCDVARILKPGGEVWISCPNAASWLRNRPDTQGIPPHTHVALTLAVDPFLRSRLILVPSAVAVMLIIALGIMVYMARRQ